MYFTEKLQQVEFSDEAKEPIRFVVAVVEKQGSFSQGYGRRYLCFDRATQLAYLSYSGSKMYNWKRVMKLYALGLNHVHCDLDFRNKDCDIRELLGFTMHGVSHNDTFDKLKTSSKSHHNSSSNSSNSNKNKNNDKDVTQLLKLPIELPHLKEIGKALDTASTATPSWGEYVEGTFASTPSVQPISEHDDEAFKKEDYTWHLRGVHYGTFHDMYMSMRDVLIADGLHVPVHGGFHNCVDPRNNLHFAHVPLHLQRYFHGLLDAVLYSCVHGELIGANDNGVISVSQYHSYLCLTNEHVLFMSEHGKALRWLPVKELNKIEYCIKEHDIDFSKEHSTSKDNTDKKEHEHHKANKRVTHTQGSPSLSPIQSPTIPGKTSEAFMVFIMSGSAPDVIFCPCDVFNKHDASHSIITHIPVMNVKSEVYKLIDIMQVLAP